MEEIRLELHTEPDAAVRVSGEGDTDFQNLTQKEQEMLLDFLEKLDMTDSSLPVTYGASCQNKIARFSDTILNTVRSEENGGAGELLNRLVDQIEAYDEETNIKSGLFKIFDAPNKSLDKLKEGYSRIESNIDRISDELIQYRRKLLRNIAMYDTLYENNSRYIKELSLYIIAGKMKMERIKEKEIPELTRKAERTESGEDQQKLRDLISACQLFERRLQDLQISHVIAMQMVPQIRLMQNNDSKLADKIQSSLVNALPLWKNQIVLALGLASTRSAMEVQRRVTDTSNEMLKKNSEQLKRSALETVKESEKRSNSIETVKKTNKDLVETIQGIMDIQHRGHEERMTAEMEFVKMEEELKKALADASRSSVR